MSDKDLLLHIAFSEMSHARELQIESETMLKKSLILSESAMRLLKEALKKDEA